jgi:hypothetical protein
LFDVPETLFATTEVLFAIAKAFSATAEVLFAIAEVSSVIAGTLFAVAEVSSVIAETLFAIAEGLLGTPAFSFSLFLTCFSYSDLSRFGRDYCPKQMRARLAAVNP